MFLLKLCFWFLVVGRCDFLDEIRDFMEFGLLCGVLFDIKERDLSLFL